MGIQTKISLSIMNQLSKNIGLKIDSLIETSYGISDTTYICNSGEKKYIFKLYENTGIKQVQSELNLYKSLNSLHLALVYNKSLIETFDSKPYLFFSYLQGASPIKIKPFHLSEMGSFLASFHEQTYLKDFYKTLNYSQKTLRKYLNIILDSHHNETIKKRFLNAFEKIKDHQLKDNHIIHGDLFPDNTKFLKDKLSGVFDFTNASKGDNLFDVAVLINSWCFDEMQAFDIQLFDSFKKSYTYENISIDSLKIYLMYSSLYYSMSRFITNYIDKKEVQYKSYEEYLNKFDFWDKYE